MTLSVPSFDEIWNSMSIDQQLEDAFAQLLSTYSQIKTVKDAFVKLTVGHIKNVERHRLSSDSFAKPSNKLSRLVEVSEKSKDLCDAVDVRDCLVKATKLLQEINTENETKCLSDVNKKSRDYVMELSMQLSDLGNRLEVAVEVYHQQEGEIFRKAETTLVGTMSDRFKKYRLAKLKGLQEVIQKKHNEETERKLDVFRKENEERAKQHAEVDTLRDEVSKLKIELSTHPLIRHRRLAVLEDRLLENRTKVILFQTKLSRLREIEEKRRLERQQRFATEIHQKPLMILAAKSMEVKEKKLRKTNHFNLRLMNEKKAVESSAMPLERARPSNEEVISTCSNLITVIKKRPPQNQRNNTVKKNTKPAE